MIVEKIPEYLLSVCLFSNPGDKVQILLEIMGQMCPVVLHLFWTLPPKLEKKPYIQMLIWYFSNNHDIYDYVGKMSEQHFSVWLFSNPGDKTLFLLKFNEARISEWNKSVITLCVISRPG